MPKRQRSTSQTREALSTTRIVSTAITIADSDGIKKVSMRRVASELGFEVMSLYNHIANKQALLVAMADQIAADIELPSADWKTAIRSNAIATQQTLQSHPWAADLWASQLPGPHRLDLMEWQLRQLAASDLSEKGAHYAFHAVNNHIVGYVIQNVAVSDLSDDVGAGFAEDFMNDLHPMRYEKMRQHIGQHIDGDSGSSFELVLDLILDGLSRTNL